VAATRTDKTAITRLARIDWQTVGRIISRVADEQLDDRRLDDLFEIGIDEIAWRGGHRYLTLVTDHRRGKIVWGAEGRSAAVADQFFADLDAPAPDQTLDAEPAHADIAGPPDDKQTQVGPRASKLTAISLDMGPGYARSAREHAPQAVICIRSVARRGVGQPGARRGPPRLLKRAARQRRPGHRQALQRRPLGAAEEP